MPSYRPLDHQDARPAFCTVACDPHAARDGPPRCPADSGQVCPWPCHPARKPPPLLQSHAAMQALLETSLRGPPNHSRTSHGEPPYHCERQYHARPNHGEPPYHPRTSHGEPPYHPRTSHGEPPHLAGTPTTRGWACEKQRRVRPAEEKANAPAGEGGEKATPPAGEGGEKANAPAGEGGERLNAPAGDQRRRVPTDEQERRATPGDWSPSRGPWSETGSDGQDRARTTRRQSWRHLGNQRNESVAEHKHTSTLFENIK